MNIHESPQNTKSDDDLHNTPHQYFNTNVPITIYHAFDQQYTFISDNIEYLAEQGYSHIQISPAQRSRTTLPKKSQEEGVDPNIWWLKYQPIEFCVGNGYGSAEELREMVDKAHSFNLRVIVDIALNFVAAVNGGEDHDWAKAETLSEQGDDRLLDELWTKVEATIPHFTRDDYKPRFKQTNRKDKINQWFARCMPALKTETNKVQQIQFAYMKELLDLGVDGFRFDCIGSMLSEVVDQYVQQIPSDKWSYLELIERRNINKILRYGKIAPILYYRFTEGLIAKFDRNGSLSQLPPLIKNNWVTFSENHDTYHSGTSGIRVTFHNQYRDGKDAILATAYILSVHDGIPLILCFTALDPIVQSGVKYRKVMHDLNAPEGQIMKTGRLSKDLCILERGTFGFVIINKSDKDIRIIELSTICQCEGRYKKINGDENSDVIISKSGNRGTLVNDNMKFYFPSRSAAFYLNEQYSI